MDTTELHVDGPGQTSDIPLSTGTLYSAGENSLSFDKTPDFAEESRKTADMANVHTDGPGKTSDIPLSTGTLHSAGENSLSFDKTPDVAGELKRKDEEKAPGGQIARSSMETPAGVTVQGVESQNVGEDLQPEAETETLSRSDTSIVF